MFSKEYDNTVDYEIVKNTIAFEITPLYLSISINFWLLTASSAYNWYFQDISSSFYSLIQQVSRDSIVCPAHSLSKTLNPSFICDCAYRQA